ncbi:25385_t:CDS:1, partial [Gigaspora rosea]
PITLAIADSKYDLINMLNGRLRNSEDDELVEYLIDTPVKDI